MNTGGMARILAAPNGAKVRAIPIALQRPRSDAIDLAFVDNDDLFAQRGI